MGQRKTLRSSAAFWIIRSAASGGACPVSVAPAASCKSSQVFASDRRTRGAPAFAIAALLCAAPLTPLGAQAEGDLSLPSTERSNAAVCNVQASEELGPAIGTARPVIAICDGHGLMLGHADTFDVIPNKALDSVLVDMRRGEDRRILLISLQGAERPLLEDLGGQISLSAGRGPMSPLENIEIDLAGFARDGTIGVRGRTEERGSAAPMDTMNLRQQITQARASRGDFAPKE